MDNRDFAMHLAALMQRAQLDFAAMAQKLDVPKADIEAWVSGGEEPPLRLLPAIASALNVSLEELLQVREKPCRVVKIVVTGGPCAGKTTAMSWIQNAFTEKGWTVLFCAETATELISGGGMANCASWQEFQRALVKLQLAKEHAWEDIARNQKNDRVLIVCDRAALDNKSYMTESEFRYVCNALHTDEVTLRDNYDAVFHLVTAAKGAEQFYGTATNAIRYESVEEARAQDDRTIAAWTGHPYLRIIDNTTAFEDKMHRLITEISKVLGESRPSVTGRKYLIRYPDTELLEKLPNCTKVEIIQSYLNCREGEMEVRLRQRGQDGHYIYYKTTKKLQADGSVIRIEKRLSMDAYLSELLDQDLRTRQIRKTRYMLSENKQYYQIDVYPEWDDVALMEVELYEADEQVTFPAEVEVIREVTGEKEYSMKEIAKR